jgi:type IV secretory pathway VirB10-like protein
MNWVLDNIRLIVIVGGGIAYWLNQRRKAKEEAEAARTIAPAPPNAPVNDEAERIRRVQEEIRRKILERVGGVTRPVPTPPPLKAAPQLTPKREQTKVEAYTDSQAEAERLVAVDQAMLERQQQLAAKLRELKEQRREHDRPSEVFAEKTALAMAASGTAVRGSLLADLREPTAVRRAIVLREVLGTPVGLR